MVGFILLVREYEGWVRFPFGGEVRWVGGGEGRSKWVQAVVGEGEGGMGRRRR